MIGVVAPSGKNGRAAVVTASGLAPHFQRRGSRCGRATLTGPLVGWSLRGRRMDGVRCPVGPSLRENADVRTPLPSGVPRVHRWSYLTQSFDYSMLLVNETLNLLARRSDLRHWGRCWRVLKGAVEAVPPIGPRFGLSGRFVRSSNGAI